MLLDDDNVLAEDLFDFIHVAVEAVLALRAALQRDLEHGGTPSYSLSCSVRIATLSARDITRKIALRLAVQRDRAADHRRAHIP